MIQISDEYLKQLVFINDNITDQGIVVLNMENWVQPDTDNEIVRVTSFIANVMTQALLKSQSVGKDKFDVIVYMEKFKISKINYKFVKYLADILKQLFPEKLRSATLIDPPKFFVASYEIIKKFLDKPTRKKLRLISTKDNRDLYFDNYED